MTPREYIAFLQVAGKLKDHTRHSVSARGREESVAEHSWRTALMAMLLAGEADGVDLPKVVQMCILHALGEAVTGDIPSFEKTQADALREHAALFRLLDKLPEPLSTQWRALFLEMEQQQTPEAKLYKALDKLEAVLQHNEAPLSSWIALEYDLNQRYGLAEAAQTLPFIQAVRALAVEDTLQKIQMESKEQITEDR